jgi:hypothetical protein
MTVAPASKSVRRPTLSMTTMATTVEAMLTPTVIRLMAPPCEGHVDHAENRDHGEHPAPGEAAPPQGTEAASDPASSVRAYPDSNPRNWPTTIANCQNVPSRPGIPVGEISEMYDGTTALAAPMPSPLSTQTTPRSSAAPLKAAITEPP